MSLQPPDAEEINIVLLGSLNPAIFHPEWFRRQGILLPVEAENAEVKVVSSDVTQVSFLDMRLEVLPNRLVLTTHDASRGEKVQDVVLGALQRLPHTPISACGINNVITFDLGDEDHWNRIGHTLAPKESVWNHVMAKPGLQVLKVRGLREGTFPGPVNITVRPSNPTQFRYGIVIHSNYHYNVTDNTGEVGSSEHVSSFLKAEWNTALEETRCVARRIFEVIPKHAD